MTLLDIRLVPDPVLRVKCQPVTEFDQQLTELASDMAETMYAAPGVGLAAPQIGVEKRLFVVDTFGNTDDRSLWTFVNPEIVEASEQTDVDVEGCLSIPGITEKVERPVRILIRAQKVDGEPFELEADGFFARAICHEFDHLNGVLFVDHLRGLRREKVRRQMKRMIKQHAAGEVGA